MSQKKQKAQEKAKQGQRHYPEMTSQDLEARLNIAGAFAQLVAEELSSLPHTEKLEDNQRPMRGAHLTIGHYIAETLYRELSTELDKVEAESDIIRLVQPSGLVDPNGNPLLN